MIRNFLVLTFFLFLISATACAEKQSSRTENIHLKQLISEQKILIIKLQAENKLYKSIVNDFRDYGGLVDKYFSQCTPSSDTKHCRQLFDKISEKTPRNEE